MKTLAIALAIIMTATLASAQDERTLDSSPLSQKGESEDVPSQAEESEQPPSISLDEILNAPSSVSEKSADVSGGWIAKAYNDFSQENDKEHLWGIRTLVSLEAIANIKRVSLRFSGYAEYDLDANQDDYFNDYYARLHELYVKYSVSKFDFRVGQQEFNWGKADLINPIDQLNPSDLTRAFNADMGFTKIPVFAARVDYYATNNHRLQAVYIPFFEPAKISFIGSDYALLKHGIPFYTVLKYLEEKEQNLKLYEHFLDIIAPNWREATKDEIEESLEGDLEDFAQMPEDNFENFDVGFLYSGKLADFDYDLCYTHTLDDFPTLHAAPEMKEFYGAIYPHLDLGKLLDIDYSALEHPIIGKFHRVNSVGAAFETGIEGFGIRGEALYTWDRYVYLKDLRLQRQGMLLGVLGVDYLFLHDYYANVQVLEILTEGDPDKLLWEKYFTFLMLMLRKPFAHDKWGLSIGTIADLTFLGTEEILDADFSDLDLHITAALSHSPADNWRIYGGINYFSGYRYSPLGYFSENSQYFLGVKYSF